MNLLKNFTILFNALYIFSLPWRESIVIEGFGTISKYVGLVSYVLFFIYLLTYKQVFKINKSIFLVILFFCWGITSTLWSYNQDFSEILIYNNIQLLLFLYITFTFSKEKKILYFFLYSYVLGCYISIISLFINFLTLDAVTSYTRYSSTNANPGTLGIILVIGVPIAWFLITYFKNSFIKFSLIFYIFLSLGAIFLTGTRTAIILWFIFLFYAFVTSYKLSIIKKILLIIILPIMLFITLNIVPENSLDRFLETKDELASGDLTNRTNIWLVAIKEIPENLFQGVGMGAAREIIGGNTGYYYVVHNTFLSVTLELGLIGFILFILIILSLISKTLKHSFHEKAFLFTLLFMWGIGANLGSDEYTKTTWLIFTIIISIRK